MWLLLLSLMGMQQEVEEGERRDLSICVRRVQPGCCPWWRGTVCTWNIEMSMNTSPVKETEMNLKYQSLS
jgi:hypothetical protein